MLNETSKPTVTHILSDAAQKAYEKIKALILKIFSLFKHQEDEKNLKEQFYDSYIDFARKLDYDGHKDESNIYMSICEMYYQLIDRPDDLIRHESFFEDLFRAFDELLYVKIHSHDGFEEKNDEFFRYYGKMMQYFYTDVAIPSENYNADTLNEITGFLVGDFND